MRKFFEWFNTQNFWVQLATVIFLLTVFLSYTPAFAQDLDCPTLWKLNPTGNHILGVVQETEECASGVYLPEVKVTFSTAKGGFWITDDMFVIIEKDEGWKMISLLSFKDLNDGFEDAWEAEACWFAVWSSGSPRINLGCYNREINLF